MTIEEAVADWRAGKIVWSVEMGGLGPGHEQCIQIVIFEVAGKFVDDPEKRNLLLTAGPKEREQLMDEATSAVGREFDLGLSGAQAGVGMSVAFQFLKYGYAEMMAKAPEDRKIQVDRAFPSIPAVKKG